MVQLMLEIRSNSRVVRCGRTATALSLVMAVFGVAACSSSGPVQQQAPGAFAAVERSASVRDPVAESFVDALVQLPGYNPGKTTLSFERRALASDPFLAALEAAVVARGYGVRNVTTIGGANMVTHEASDDPAAVGVVVRTLSFGEAQMRRSFLKGLDGSWSPRSSLFIRGADASRVRLGDDPAPRLSTAQAAPVRPVPVQPAPVQPAQTKPGQQQALGPSTPAIESSGNALTAARQDRSLASNESSATVTPVPARPALKQASPETKHHSSVPQNVAEIGSSNFSGLFEGYGDFNELVLVFPDDSMVLGAGNKRKIRAALSEADSDQDLFSIVGCSFGPTKIDNGNELLAIGRANRVKEELMFSGIPRERILDEGCWAGAPEVEFPARGVVLTIKRSRA